MALHPDWMQPPAPIRIGISSCLLGEAVRFDGQHRRDAFITGTLGAYVRFVPVCPEVAVGLGTPRPPIRLVAAGDGPPRALGVRDPTLDPSDALRAYGRRMAAELDDLCGYLFKRGSPSCGMERVQVHRGAGTRGGAPSRRGVGLYATEIMSARPELPCEEEGRLGDPALRENFIERVCAYHRWRALLAGGLTPERLAAFHHRHQLALLAHGAEPARRLGRIVAGAGRARGKAALAALGAEYGRAFMDLLRRRATRRTHTNVLRHLRGTLKRELDGADQAELDEAIDAYRTGQVPRIVPITLLKHHFRRHPQFTVAGQTYLEPHPLERMLRNGG